MNDAELSVGIEDNVSPQINKIVAAVRSLGQAVNSEAKTIDKAAASVSKSLVQMTQGGAGSAASTRPKALEQATAQLAKYRAEMDKLSHASDVKLTESGRFQSVSTGRLVSGADVTAYEQASAKAAALERNITRFTEAQKTANVTTSTYAKVSNEAYQAQRRVFNDVDTSKVDRSAKTLQKVYADMWGARSQFKEFWPPEMFKGVDGFVSAMEQMPNSARYALYDVANSTAIAGAALGTMAVGAVGVAASFQRSFADVKRTVQGTDQDLAKVRASLIDLSSQAPVAFGDLAQIASVGGQMGIGVSGIVNYTETIAKLTATTNLTADAASMALGRFKAFFAEASSPGLAVTDATFENLASSILKVGVNSVATETGIVNVATQISSMGSYAGMTANQVIGVAGALSSIGVPPELSRGVITRLFNNIGEAASNGGARLEGFSQLAGVSAEDFKNSWRSENFAGTFTSLIAGLGDLSRNGGDAVGVLHELGITSVRDVPVLLRLANAAGEAGTAGSLLAQTMGDAETGWKQNTELAAQYALISETLVERLKVLGNAFSNLFASIGDVAVGPATALVDVLINVVNGLRIISESPAGQIIGGITLAMTLLTAATLLAGAGFARFITFSQSAVTGLTAMRVPLTVATTLVNGLKFAMLGVGAVFTIMALAAPFIAMQDAAVKSSAAVQNNAAALAALRADSDSGAKAVATFTTETGKAGTELSKAEKMGAAMSGVLGNMADSGSAGADGVEAVTRSMFKFGDASRDFIKNAVMADEGLQKFMSDDFWDGGDGIAGFAGFTEKAGYSIDRVIDLYAKGGREAAEGYLAGLSGIDTAAAWDKSTFGTYTNEVARAQDALLNAVGAQLGGLEQVAIQGLNAGDAMRTFGEGTQYATDVSEEFAVANEDALKKAGEALAKFVDPKKLTKFTQDFGAAAKLQGEEQEKAAQKAQDAWDTYYGGGSISLNEYLKVFEGAARIQQDHIENLNQLASRNQLSEAILQDLREMGPDAVPLVQALVKGTDAELKKYKELYGQTGFDAMVALAASQLRAKTIVDNAAKSLGTSQMALFTEELRKGTPLVDALKKWNLDANGMEIKVPAIADINAQAERNRIQQQLGKPINIPINPYLTKTTVAARPSSNTTMKMSMYADGGFTGRGAKWAPRGIVHAGEVVTPQRDVDQSTGQIKKEALVRMLNGGRQARPSGANGYANGGFVGRGGGAGTVELGAATIQAIARSIDPRVFLDGQDLSRSTQRAAASQQYFGEG